MQQQHQLSNGGLEGGHSLLNQGTPYYLEGAVIPGQTATVVQESVANFCWDVLFSKMILTQLDRLLAILELAFILPSNL